MLRFGLGLTLTCLMLTFAACGGGSGDKTFERGEVAFSYPEEWDERTLEGGPVTPDALFATVFAPGEGLNGLIFEISEGPISVTKSNLDAVLQDIAAGLDESTEGPTRTSVAGLPALSFESHPQSDLTRAVTFAFDGKTWYAFNCGYTAELAAEIKQGCEQVLSSFEVQN